MSSPYTFESVMAMTPKDLESTYSGREGKCCCGCSGKHYHYLPTGDYRAGGTLNDQRMCRRILKAVQDNLSTADFGENNVCVTVGERWYIIYPADTNRITR